jgi:hypothetical protein
LLSLERIGKVLNTSFSFYPHAQKDFPPSDYANLPQRLGGQAALSETENERF